MGAVKPVGQLSKCINEPLSGLESLLYVCFSNSESGETNISGTNKTDRNTRTTRGRPVFDVNTKFAADQNSHFAVYRNQTSEHTKNRNKESFLQVSLSSIIVQKQKYRTLAHWN